MFKKFFNSYLLKQVLITFACLAGVYLTCFLIVYLTNMFEPEFMSNNILSLAIILLVLSVLIGTMLSYFGTMRNLRHQENLQKVVSEILQGNFDAKMPEKDAYTKKLNKDINKIFSELKKVEILKKDFISNFSHEFKTPIVSINGFSELLLNEKLSKKTQKEYLQIIYDESSRLAKLSKNMLLLSNLESTSIVPETNLYALDEQILSTTKLLSKELESKKLVLDLKLENSKITANMDMLQQVWINLLTNAIKFSNEGDAISISLKNAGNQVIIRIKDNGAGMNEEQLSHIFEKFYQGDKSHKSEGNGLGLAIAKQIITLHGGNIQVSSKENKGTEFVVMIPKQQNNN